MKRKLLWLGLPSALVLIIAVLGALIIREIKVSSVTNSVQSSKLKTIKTASLTDIPSLQTNFTVNNLSGKSEQHFNQIHK
ncbi:hypothetical protein ACL36S_05075 [Lactiplantibacillus plantarum]|uniref:hypothetical protein n=1 Tax=Lactiplantibacillus plantarum TaxID=1590 RepID=UPI001FCDA69E|nr:hypothetical protein [Lactiplantibacillus plantarum]MCJ2385478.1 hypothetical protein [Lactiplantibacillus plantarum]